MKAATAIFGGVVAIIVSCSTSPPPAVDCDPRGGFINCNNVCVKPFTDTENCGSCGKRCGVGEACVNGVCGTSCPKGNLLCGGGDGGAGTCVNALTDNANCGKCGNACSGSQICYNGQCNGSCGDSNTGQTLCVPDGGVPYCANLATDNLNCGSCGKACDPAQACVASVCTNECAQNQTFCTNGGNPFCTDTTTDNANCGGCGNTCTGALQVCAGGACSSECDAYQSKCGGDGGAPYCVNSPTDNSNCGGCGKVCPSTAPVCASGKCVANPPQGMVYFTDGTTQDISIVPCSTGAYSSCTATSAVSTCTGIGKTLVVYENINSASSVTALSTESYVYYPYTVGYFVNYDASRAGQCLVAFQGVDAYYCSYYYGYSNYWDGTVEQIPTTTGKQFGYIYPYGDQGYQSAFTNSIQSYDFCRTSTTATYSYFGCSTYYVACL